MGASIIWAYIELYGEDRLRKAVFIDQVTQSCLPPLRQRHRSAGQHCCHRDLS